MVKHFIAISYYPPMFRVPSTMLPYSPLTPCCRAFEIVMGMFRIEAGVPEVPSIVASLDDPTTFHLLVNIFGNCVLVNSVTIHLSPEETFAALLRKVHVHICSNGCGSVRDRLGSCMPTHGDDTLVTSFRPHCASASCYAAQSPSSSPT